MIELIRKELENVKQKIKDTEMSLFTDKKDWREFSSTINPIIIAGNLETTMLKLQETLDMEGTEKDREDFNYIKEIFNQAFMYSDLSDTGTKGKIFDASGLIAGKGEVKGNVLIVNYSKEDVEKFMKEEDEKIGENEWVGKV